MTDTTTLPVAHCSLCDQNREIPHFATLYVGNEVSRFPVCAECGVRLREIVSAIALEQSDCG